MKKLIALLLALLCSIANAGVGLSNSSGVSVSTCDNYAGAICSLKYRGRELLDRKDAGRLLQYAVSANGMGEYYNPTQGGSFADGINPSNSSSIKLVESLQGTSAFVTEDLMAYWFPVNGKAVSDFIGMESTSLSGHTLTITTSFILPSGQTYNTMTFETLTGYFTTSLSQFKTWSRSGGLQPLSDGPGEQQLPIVFHTTDGSAAVGICSTNITGGGYGRWRFVDTVKWNTVVRGTNVNGMYSFTSYVVVGTLTEVSAEMGSVCPL